MRQSEHCDSIAPCLVVALNKLKDIARSETANAGSYSYKYATLAQAAQQAREVLGEYGLAVHQDAHGDTLGSVSVTTRIWHASGQWVESEPLVMPAKGGPQDVGSAVSYARRYSLMATLGLATDDDDGAGAQAAHSKPEPAHPMSERVAAVLADMKALSDTKKNDLRKWADGRKLSGAALLANEAWLGHVEDWIAEYGGAS
jgi:hypothetical protein